MTRPASAWRPRRIAGQRQAGWVCMRFRTALIPTAGSSSVGPTCSATPSRRGREWAPPLTDVELALPSRKRVRRSPAAPTRPGLGSTAVTANATISPIDMSAAEPAVREAAALESGGSSQSPPALVRHPDVQRVGSPAGADPPARVAGRVTPGRRRMGRGERREPGRHRGDAGGVGRTRPPGEVRRSRTQLRPPGGADGGPRSRVWRRGRDDGRRSPGSAEIVVDMLARSAKATTSRTPSARSAMAKPPSRSPPPARSTGSCARSCTAIFRRTPATSA